MEPRDRGDLLEAGPDRTANRGQKEEEGGFSRLLLPRALHPAPHLIRVSQPADQGDPGSKELQASPQTQSEAFTKTWREQLCDYSLNFALIQHSSPLRHD